MSDQGAPSVIDQLAGYGTLLDGAAEAAAVNADAPRPATDPQTVPSHRRAWPLLGVAVTLVLVILVARLVSRDDSSMTRERAGGANRVAQLRASVPLGQNAAPWGTVFDGRDVWTVERFAINPDGSMRPEVSVVRRNPSSGKATKRIVLPQESALAIASDGYGALYVLGGGDGGVPSTSVSKVDIASGRVMFTTTLTEPCSCQIAAGAGGVWVGANGSSTAYRLEPGTGKIASEVALPAPAMSIAVVGDFVEVGLIDARVAVIDPANEEAVRSISLVQPREPPASGGPVRAITPIRRGAASSVTRGDGATFVIAEHRQVESTGRFARPVDAVAYLDGVLYAVADRDGPELSSLPTGAARSRLLAVVPSPPAPTSESDLPGTVTAAGDVLWVVVDGEGGRTALVIRPRS
jgi:hypothetical protein